MIFFHKDVLEPKITVMGNCPSCGEFVRWGLAQCPQCETLLDKEQMLKSAQEHFRITQAVSSANTIRTFRPAAYIFIAIAVGNFLLASRSIAIWLVCFFPLVAVIRWFFKHGRWYSANEDYLEAKKKMKSDLLLWLALNFLNLIWLTVRVGRTK